ncbi:MAG: class II aldolase/adducin family protein [Deltaproteobacteria bacterium]|nr:class II aldolase/adducin family protein [Deltaproteobacteria bacterium]MBI2342560.1 class II aldolase/adducin family protein [Deltaproteobacteria bacterium]
MDPRKEICNIGRKLEAKGLVAATDGNISFRIAPDRILITPSGVSKGALEEDSFLTINTKGAVVAGSGRPSSEISMHLAVYEKRPDVKAVIHAHPPITTALTVAGIELAQCVIPEVVITMGSIPTAEYATPCTEEGAIAIKNLIQDADAIILDRHGSLTVGDSLQSAYFKLEKLEHAANVTATARMLGKVKVLPENEVKKLIDLRQKLGIKSRSNPCDSCRACEKEPKEKINVDNEALVNLLTDEIVKRIQK